MKSNKVCLVTGAAGTVGQHLLSHLVKKGYKVIALGEARDVFSPVVLKNKNIKITTALPISSARFKKYDVQFCLGDVSDISFLASVFSTADKNNIVINFIFHLSANELIQKHSPAAYQPDFADTVNVLEVARAYWQGHKKDFKGFLYAADTGKKTALQIEKLIDKIREKDDFPAVVYHSLLLSDIIGNYRGKTALSSLYRIMTPFKTPALPMAWKKEADDELGYIAGLSHAADKIIAQAEAGKTITLED